jgi:outer membrane protein assembly factor BamB
MNRTNRKWQILLLIVAICSMYSFSIPTHFASGDFSLHKEATLEKKSQVHFYLHPTKNKIAPISSTVSLRDKIPPRSILEGIYTLPSKYWIGNTYYDGFPSVEEYDSVDGLEWSFPPSKSHLWEQIGMTIDYNIGNCVREDITAHLQTTPSYIYPCDVTQQNPIIQEVDQKRIVVFSTLNEGIVCLDACSGQKVWDFIIAPGERIVEGMSSFRYKGDVYIVAATTHKKIFFIAAENGKIVQTLYTDAAIVSALHTFTWQDTPYVAFCTSKKAIIQEVFSKTIVWQDQTHFAKALSPISVMANHTFVVIFPFYNGSIVGVHLATKEKWQKQVDGQIPYNVTCVSWNGTPYIGLATSKKKLLFLHPSDGKTLLSEEIPGEPKTNVMFLPQDWQYFVVTKHASDENKIVFVSGQLGEKKAQKAIPIPGKEIYGFCGYRQGSVNQFLFTNERREFFSLSSTDAKIASSYPRSLSSIRSPLQENSIGTCFALSEQMMWAVIPGEGLFRFGNPTPHMENSALTMQTYLSTVVSNTAPSFTTGESCYREADALPLDSDITFLPQDVHLYDETRPIPIPGCFWDPRLEQWLLMQTDPKGNIVFFDAEKKARYTIPISIGYCYTQPILERNQKGNWNIFAISEREAVYLEFSPHNQQVSVLWEATDMKSTGSSLFSCNYEEESFFIFVSDTGYLIALNKKDGSLRYKKKADAWTFCTNFLEDRPVVFCGKDILDACNGEVLSSFGYSQSDSTTISMDGTLLWLQSFEDDMICKNPKNGDIVWKVRKLWCKKYCYRSTSPAILQKGNIHFSYWSDYTRGVCVDIRTGMIRWRLSLMEDYIVEKPIVVDTKNASYVLYSTVKGKIYVLDAMRGTILHIIQLPKEFSPQSIYTGISTAGFVNGMILVSRVGHGLYLVGTAKATNKDYPPKHFFVSIPTIEKKKKRFLWNRAELYWKDRMCFSNVVRIPVP